jgi:DNA-binding PadR family transcriptional regulator
MKAMTPTDLPNTAYAVLGLLSLHQELSGYEIRQIAQNLRFFYWSPAQSQIYAELRRLLKLDLVDVRDVEQQGKPDKRLYKINERGLAELKRWLNEETVEPPVLKHSVALRLFFGHMAEPGRLQEVLEDFIQETEQTLQDLSNIRKNIKDNADLRYPALVALWGLHYYQAEVDTAKEMLEHLNTQENEPGKRVLARVTSG